MEKKYTVLDQETNNAGSLQLAICDNFGELEKVMPFRWLEWMADYQKHPSPSSFGFQCFKKQLPVAEIYPVAVLEHIEIDDAKRNKGIGRRAIRAFRAVAEEYKSRLGLLKIGKAGPDEDYDSAVARLRPLYESEGWKCFEKPPLDGVIWVYMYHLLPPLLPAERALRCCLVEKTLDETFYGVNPLD